MSVVPIGLCQLGAALRLPLYTSRVQAGFPSPADDFIENRLDLNEYLIRHPAATFFTIVAGDSMEGVGIFAGDILAIDRALDPRHGDVVVACVQGEFTCKILDYRNKTLLAAKDGYPPIPLSEEGAQIEGVVPFSIRWHRVRPC